jgi:predicted Zn-dependent protease
LLKDIETRFRAVVPACDAWTLRVVRERSEYLCVRRDVVQPVRTGDDFGAMISIAAGGGIGYAATSDVTQAGLGAAAQRARQWAVQLSGRLTPGCDELPQPQSGEYESPVVRGWETLGLADRIGLLRSIAVRLRRDQRIVNWEAALWHNEADVLVAGDAGGRACQRITFLLPMLTATANQAAETQTRTFGGHAYCRQGGLEILDDVGFAAAAPVVGEQALELLSAPNCPQETSDVVLAPDQMILQIHESIGHPLELDRILGDERNYAGRSFVTPEMFGNYRYGSDLLNVSFDPTHSGELASGSFDDEGQPAERREIIRDGVLLRALGGALSQRRAGMPGVANARASSWNRPPIDRIGNLNIEPGTGSLADLIGRVERGVYMETNCSWSIDDSRNKFQFGCELARRIENGALKEVLKNPNYRGVSATFWRNLKGVGGPEAVSVLGTPYCGKGEPNQVMRVGHASPPCLFDSVEVFGGA